MRLGYVAILILIACALPGCGASGVQVNNAWLRPIAQGGVDAAYLSIRNASGKNDRLLRVECDAATSVEIHTMVDRNGVIEMRPIDSLLDIPTNSELEFGTGHMHIMLIDMKRDLAAGDTVHLTLYFEQFGSVKIVAQVRAL